MRHDPNLIKQGRPRKRDEPIAVDLARSRKGDAKHPSEWKTLVMPDADFQGMAIDTRASGSDDDHSPNLVQTILRQDNDRASVIHLRPPDFATLHKFHWKWTELR